MRQAAISVDITAVDPNLQYAVLPAGSYPIVEEDDGGLVIYVTGPDGVQLGVGTRNPFVSVVTVKDPGPSEDDLITWRQPDGSTGRVAADDLRALVGYTGDLAEEAPHGAH